MLTEQEILKTCQAINIDLLMAFPDTRVEKLIGYVSLIQVRLLKDVVKQIRDTAFIMGNDMWKERNQVNDVANFFEEQAKEIAAKALQQFTDEEMFRQALNLYPTTLAHHEQRAVAKKARRK